MIPLKMCALHPKWLSRKVLLTMGLQRETAGRGTMAVYVQIIFATIFERVIFHTSPSLLSLFGTLIILTSAVYVALIKVRTQANNPSGGITASDDASVEEGLLANAEDEPLQDSKDIELATVVVVGSDVLHAPSQEHGTNATKA
ncbi:hypothetical protein TRAPUB_1916 [Trametes pubescens]|uniref:Uncharacterized protein n=1 Tax=Trametes pubescens TaxID=154538 RepID=A0A1M2VI38_TRAPU|nr:hypothetical protein TRAPUB_1916 [Trametes pubescens]